MLSGIGPERELRRHGIEVKQNLCGVGRNLMDHVCVYLQHECSQPVSLQPVLTRAGRWRAGLQWLLTHRGHAATTHSEACGFVRSASGVEWPDIQMDFFPIAIMSDETVADVAHGFSNHVGNLRPKSRGSVRLRSANPADPPVLTFNYLQHEDDRAAMRAAVRLTREVHNQPALDAYRGKELEPGEAVVNDQELDAFVREAISSNYHATGTCKMGDDAQAVVDSECRVRGIDGLRIADASVMPQIISGNTNAPTIMIGEKVADHIKGVPMEHAPVAFARSHAWQDQQREHPPARRLASADRSETP